VGRSTTATLLSGALALAGCATLQAYAALRSVAFDIDRVDGLRLAGVALDHVRRFEDLGAVDAGRIALALASRQVPLEMRLHLLATNPADNAVSARLAGLDWTLFLQERETVSGGLPAPVVLPPGMPTVVPITVRLDLIQFFEGSAADLVELVLGLAGHATRPTQLRLQATPIVDTPLGPIRYPQPISIVRRVGG
jgi:hypothetical protein